MPEPGPGPGARAWSPKNRSDRPEPTAPLRTFHQSPFKQSSLSDRSTIRLSMRRIVRNKAIDWLRKNGSARLSEWSAADGNRADESPDAEQLLIAGNTGEWLRLALSRLSLEQREAVLLCYFEERPLAEIAAIQTCPEGTVKTRLFHARLNLRSLLAEPEMAL